jgi:hypothetical protein
LYHGIQRPGEWYGRIVALNHEAGVVYGRKELTRQVSVVKGAKYHERYLEFVENLHDVELFLTLPSLFKTELTGHSA